MRIRRNFLNNFPIIRIENGVEVGPACLKMIAKYYGKEFDLGYLAKISKMHALDGTSLRGLRDAGEIMGFRTMAVRIPLRSNKEGKLGLINAPFPLIIHWQGYLVCGSLSDEEWDGLYCGSMHREIVL